MEHRLSQRRAVALPVTVEYNGAQVGKAQVKNICFDGAFIEIPSPLRFHVDGVLTLSLSEGCVAPRPPIRVPAVVVHRRSDGVGVAFLRDDHMLHKCIEGIMREAEPIKRRITHPTTHIAML